MRPVIGVIPLYDEKKDSLWMLPGYFDGITEAGGMPLMFPLTSNREMLQQAVDMCDGILFTGGHDVAPELFGEAVLDPDLCSYCPERDRMEMEVLEMAMQKDMPILGICRGIQLINAALGGTLYQDLPQQHPSAVTHHQQPPYDRAAHTVRVAEGSPLYSVVGQTELPVNSCHHQAVRELAPDLRPMATADDGIVEAAFHPDLRFLWAVQWHPEFSHLTDAFSKKIFRAFVEACR